MYRTEGTKANTKCSGSSQTTKQFKRYDDISLGLARTIHIYGVNTVFLAKKFSKYTVIYGVHIPLWPTLQMSRLISNHETSQAVR